MSRPTSGERTASFRDLVVWQRALDLVAEVDAVARRFPHSAWSIRRQLERAATSIPANIAEGNGRGALVDYLRFLRVANGSLNELETHLAVARRLDYLDATNAAALHVRCREVGHLLGALIRSLRAKEAAQRGR